ncbi:MAG: molecular chaperone Hsp90 [Lacrimispora sp.]|uniref:molecular chaperone Hsp90 n=1 Tax=Lacrimispora sp. TaxID=2719234 RepID=UPI0039E6AB10
MDKELLNYTVEKTHELMNAPSCSKEAKTAAQTWLDAVGTEKEAAETKNYIDELAADIMPIDGLIGFAESDTGVQIFGADTAKHIAAHAKEIKSAGANYCDCPACAAAAAILDKKEELLK